MKKFLEYIFFPVALALSMLIVLLLIFSHESNIVVENPANSPSSNASNGGVTSATSNSSSTKIVLDVPFVGEAPDNVWTGPWKNGCEEASMTMIENFYKGNKNVAVADAKKFMQTIFDAEDKLYGSNANSDAVRTAYLINNYTLFTAVVKENPTIQDIKNEIQKGFPVITFHRGFDLNNKNIPFLATGSSYHAMVVKGYDDIKRQFITNDDGDLSAGFGHTYGYSLFMNSLHDYDYSNNKADGPARVIFTTPKG